MGQIWPRPDERHRGTRRPLDVAPPAADGGYWVARAEALPEHWTVGPDRLVWAAGTTTWRRLAARGVWVHGCADGLGDHERPAADWLAGRAVVWHRLTHRAAAAVEPGALATYVVEEPLPDDLAERTHFFWTSGTLFLEAIGRWPELRERFHGAGPGRTWRTVRETLGPGGRVGVWLDYDHWQQEVLA
jgi:hydroxymethylbilane synthase